MVKGVDLRSTGVNSAWVRTPQLTLAYCIPLIFVRFQASVKRKDVHEDVRMNMTPVGFEPTQLALVELESTPIRPLGQSVVLHRGLRYFGRDAKGGVKVGPEVVTSVWLERCTKRTVFDCFCNGFARMLPMRK